MLLCSEQKCIRSQKYAAEKGLPVLKNVLLPKTKGLFACLEELKDSLDAGYLMLPLSQFHDILFNGLSLFR